MGTKGGTGGKWGELGGNGGNWWDGGEWRGGGWHKASVSGCGKCGCAWEMGGGKWGNRGNGTQVWVVEGFGGMITALTDGKMELFAIHQHSPPRRQVRTLDRMLHQTGPDMPLASGSKSGSR